MFGGKVKMTLSKCSGPFWPDMKVDFRAKVFYVDPSNIGHLFEHLQLYILVNSYTHELFILWRFMYIYI